MHVYIVCFCGRSIADIKELFIKLSENNNRNVASKKKIELLPSSMTAADFINSEAAAPILDKLGVHQQCCRTRILTQITMDERLEPVVEPKNYALRKK